MIGPVEKFNLLSTCDFKRIWLLENTSKCWKCSSYAWLLWIWFFFSQ